MQTIQDSIHASSRPDVDESQVSPKLWLGIVVVLNVAIVLALLYTLFKDAAI